MSQQPAVHRMSVSETHADRWLDAAFRARQGGVTELVANDGAVVAAVMPAEVAHDWLTAWEDLEAAEQAIRRLGEMARAFRGEPAHAKSRAAMEDDEAGAR